MRPTAEERTSRFTNFFRSIALKHDIARNKNAQEIDFKRIAYLCGNEMISYYGHMIGQDAQYHFFWWASKHSLRCKEICEVERKRSGRPCTPPFSRGKQIYDKLSFVKYTKIAESILFEVRYPILKREPVTSMTQLLTILGVPCV